MDKRLEKIRHFKGTVMDFETYVQSKIDQTKSQNKKDKKIKESIDFTCNDEPKYNLCRIFGEPANIICYVTDCLRETNHEDLLEEYKQKAMEKDYNNLILVSMNYLNICNQQ